MRIKFLSVIVSFLIVSFALSSCLDSDDNYEFSSDATIHAFGHRYHTLANITKDLQLTSSIDSSITEIHCP